LCFLPCVLYDATLCLFETSYVLLLDYRSNSAWFMPLTLFSLSN
jgi:hypothetical protein